MGCKTEGLGVLQHHREGVVGCLVPSRLRPVCLDPVPIPSVPSGVRRASLLT